MKQFDTNRFLNVAKWDLAINRQFYLRSALVILVVMALPAMGSLLRYITLEPVAAYTFMHQPSASVAWGSISCFFIVLPLLFGYMLHNLRSRQGRIIELTLPASNAEKFLWHTCLILLGSLCVAVVSFLLIDLCYNLCLGLYTSFSHTEEFIVSMVRVSRAQRAFDIYGGLGWKGTMIRSLFYLLFLSTFVLGNALKYRQNIVLTIAWNLALIFATYFVAAICFVLIMRKYVEDQFYTGAHHWADFIDGDAWMAVVSLILLCLIVGCWAWAFRLYTKAAITSRRNR